jgi:hypothetical protein
MQITINIFRAAAWVQPTKGLNCAFTSCATDAGNSSQHGHVKQSQTTNVTSGVSDTTLARPKDTEPADMVTILHAENQQCVRLKHALSQQGMHVDARVHKPTY